MKTTNFKKQQQKKAKLNQRTVWAVITLLFCVIGLYRSSSAEAAGIFVEGSLWKAIDDNRVYVISKDHKRHIPNQQTFLSYGWKPSDVQTVDQGLLATIPDARVIKETTSATVYTLVQGSINPIASEDEFISRGFSWSELQIINNVELQSYAASSGISVSPEPTPTTPEAPTATSQLLEKIDEARALLHKAPLLYPQQKNSTFSGLLTRGAEGSEVELLQKTLLKTGHFPKATTINGVFGPTTQAAVKAFQKTQGIEQTGNVGPQTLRALEKFGLSVQGSVVRQWRATVPAARDVLLAVWNSATDDMRLVQISLAGSKVTSKTAGFSVRRLGGTGVNVQYEITSPPGYQVLANRFPIFDEAGGKVGTFPPREEVYVPFSATFLDPVIVAAGRQYMDEVVAKALTDLTNRGVASVSGKGLVGQLTDANELKNIAIIEHIDYNEFRKAEDKDRVVNKVFAILATNREDAYQYSGSSAGALGIAQFIPSSYEGMRKRYPSANLNPNFRVGMADHVNAFKAMALHHDSTGATLENHVVAHLGSDDPAKLSSAMAEVRAAAYNGGPARVKTAIQKYGEQWKVTVNSRYGLRGETRSYLEKFDAVEKLLSTPSA